jgi:hypothetical protein
VVDGIQRYLQSWFLISYSCFFSMALFNAKNSKAFLAPIFLLGFFFISGLELTGLSLSLSLSLSAFILHAFYELVAQFNSLSSLVIVEVMNLSLIIIKYFMRW